MNERRKTLSGEVILSFARQEGFQRAYICPANVADNVPFGISTLLLLLKKYWPWNSPVDAFYVADNQAYKAANALVSSFTETGEESRLLPRVNLKSLCSRISPFFQGKNTLHYHDGFGSRFCLQLIGLKSEYDKNTYFSVSEDKCGKCTLCFDACPTHAISEIGFEREKCIRYYMLSGHPIPLMFREAMGTRLIGCDLCQRVCPHNKLIHKIECDFPFSVKELLPPGKEIVKKYSDLIGNNYANANRLCAQALLISANSTDPSVISQIWALRNHPSEVVRTNAQWAAERLHI